MHIIAALIVLFMATTDSAGRPGSARPQHGSDILLTRYASVLVDSTFKRIFGTEGNKELLMLFLQKILPQRRIRDIHYDCPQTSTVEKICYALGHMTTFDKRPVELKGRFFEILFNLAEIAKFDPDERIKYEHDMTTERDRINQLAYAVEKAEERGREQGREEGAKNNALVTARNLKALGVPTDVIIKATGLAEEEVAELK